MIRACRLLGMACLILISACSGGGPGGDEENVTEENFMGEKMIGSGGSPADQVWCEVLEQQAPRKDCELISKVAQVTDGSAALNVPDPMKRADRTSVTLIVDRRAPNVIRDLDAEAEHNAAATTNEFDTAASPGNQAEPDANTTGTVAAGEKGNTTEQPPAPDPTGVQNPTPKQQADKLPGTTESYGLKVGRRMRADLTGQGFKITRASPEIQEIPLDDQGTWTWEVVAEQGGPKTLTVTTVVEAVVNEHPYQLRQTKHMKTITVGVSLLDRIKDALKALPEWLRLIAAALTALAGVAGAWWLVKRNWRSGPDGGKPSGDGTP